MSAKKDIFHAGAPLTKSERLLAIMDALRRRRQPVTAATLAQEQGVSERTIYRDVLALQTLGALIDGEAGIGYVLRPGFFLPPLSFSQDELEAIVLGVRWVAAQPDAALSNAAKSAIAKIASVAPLGRAESMDDVGLWPSFAKMNWQQAPALQVIRQAIREEVVLHIVYTDESGKTSERDIWPVQLFFYEGKQIVAAWCCTRSAFRHFRIDRIGEVKLLQTAFGTPRRVLARAWREAWTLLHPDWVCSAE
jgi:predicted DNA-binding transcriptional regulator YafY